MSRYSILGGKSVFVHIPFVLFVLCLLRLSLIYARILSIIVAKKLAGSCVWGLTVAGVQDMSRKEKRGGYDTMCVQISFHLGNIFF